MSNAPVNWIPGCIWVNKLCWLNSSSNVIAKQSPTSNLFIKVKVISVNYDGAGVNGRKKIFFLLFLEKRWRKKLDFFCCFLEKRWRNIAWIFFWCFWKNGGEKKLEFFFCFFLEKRWRKKSCIFFFCLSHLHHRSEQSKNPTVQLTVIFLYTGVHYTRSSGPFSSQKVFTVRIRGCSLFIKLKCIRRRWFVIGLRLWSMCFGVYKFYLTRT